MHEKVRQPNQIAYTEVDRGEFVPVKFWLKTEYIKSLIIHCELK